MTISAVLPTYNRAHLLEAVLESILKQTRAPDEVIIVDDGSTDGTRELLERYPAVTAIHQANQGAPIARNNGAAAATSEWIAFQDSDDLWEPEHLERLEAAAEATDHKADVYGANLRLSPGAGSALLFTKAKIDVPAPHLFAPDGRDIVLRDHLPLMLQSSVVRRAAFERLGGFHLGLPTRQDTHLFLRLGIGGPVCLIPELNAIMGGDENDDRLTNNTRGSASYHAETVRMYRDVLAQHTLSGTERKSLKARIAGAERSLGRIAWKSGQSLRGLRHLTNSFFASPSMLIGTVQRRLGRSTT